MKILLFITLGSLFCFSALAEDKYAKKGAAWKTWQKFMTHVEALEEKKVKEILGKDLAVMTMKDGMESLADILKRQKQTFVREFKGDDKNKDKMFLVLVSRFQRNSTIVMQLKDEVWRIIAIDRVDPKGPKDIKDIKMDMKVAVVRAKLARVKSKLKNIGTTYAIYFADGEFTHIASPQKTEVDPEIMKYTHPETGKVHKFLFVKGGLYEGSAVRLLAATDVKILGQYWGAYGDGHVAAVSDAGFEKYKVAFGIKKQELEKVNFSKEKQEVILAEIKTLGAGKYKERKAAKAKLLKRGEGVVAFLKQNLKQDDFEVVISLKEIIKELTPKVFNGDRPEL